MPCSPGLAEFEVDVMGHVMSEVPETGEKRPPEYAAEQLIKRIRPGGWTEETPPPSPHESSSEASEDESEDEEEEEEEAEKGYQGSILASCLLSDKRSGFAAEPEPACELGRAPGQGAGFGGWYADSGYQRPQNQTVECDGKSYIQLGAVPARRERSQFYRYQRFTALHATLIKLSRHRRTMDPLLRKSVLLFNTMRHIERELEQEGLTLAAAFNPHQFDSGPLTLDPPPVHSPPPAPPTPPPPAPLPPPPSDEINWGSVLSLGSQPDMELLPCDPAPPTPHWPLPPLSADVLRSVPERRDDLSPPPADTVSLLAL
ncbi:uncharacterized protein LOC122367799 [Amphibalanus amphitrite]|uniref:uncharacterized protein LOC122367799 n=1 Tax=Amphibalanus amphitrite TaxID=1232801 RepID=UPI001C91CF7F|nr:uncharacterized protein LOC122367799 [Amphibalanus amphitrite]